LWRNPYAPMPTKDEACSLSSHLLAEIAQTVDDLRHSLRRVVSSSQSPLADLADRTRPGVLVCERHRPRPLRDALNVRHRRRAPRLQRQWRHSRPTAEGVGIVCRRRRRRDLRDDLQATFDLEEYFLPSSPPQPRTRSRTPITNGAFTMKNLIHAELLKLTHNSDDLWLGRLLRWHGTHSVFGAIVSRGKSGGGPALEHRRRNTRRHVSRIVGRPSPS